jgi:ribosome-associated protein
MDIRKLQRAIVDGLEDVKAQNIQVFNTEHLSPLFERVIVASGTSNRQTRALASSVREAVKKAGLDVLRTEGEDNGEWIIVDCGAAVVHVMQPTIRDYYHLEEIWGDKPVNLKAAALKGLVKASEPDAGSTVKKGKTAAPRRSGSASDALKSARSPAKKTAAPAKAAAAPAKRASPAKKAAPAPSRAAPVKRAAAPARPAAAKKAAPAKRSAAPTVAPAKRAAPARKVAAPAAPAKRAAPVKRAAPATRAAPAKKAAAPAKRAAPARKAAAPKKAAR